MSYSFGITASTKALAKLAVAAKMAEVVFTQKCHARDMLPAIQVANAFIDQLDDSLFEADVAVTMNGSLAGTWEGSDVVRCSSANVSVTAYLVGKSPA